MPPDSNLEARSSAFDSCSILVCFSGGLLDVQDRPGQGVGVERVVAISVPLRDQPSGVSMSWMCRRVWTRLPVAKPCLKTI